ncbi:histidine kinase [Halovivax sp.]|uniref:histidine kinase n=1 Tax=Halovivax sp. TaxID=1935978 RepID=UPI0025C667BF|nr:histidine kinase [Halovivax sp.]
MASRTAGRTDTGTRTRLEPWQAGLVGGVAGGVAFGAMMTMTMGPIIEMAIPGMYGLGPSLAVGWAIHMLNSIVLGVVFGALLGTTGFGNRLGSNASIAAAGLAYGIVLWLVLASFVMPAWVGAMTEMAPPVPDWNGQSLLGHAVYGVILGLAYALIART